MGAVRFTCGVHNLHDYTGTPTLFADLIAFCEAIPLRIAKVIHGTPYKMVMCNQQPDLVLVYDQRVFRQQLTRRQRYVKYVDGWAGVTPNRGTFLVPLIHRVTKRKVSAVIEHRINAAFPPFIRGEGEFRHKHWKLHTEGTLRIMARQDAKGYLVVSAGDDNTPNGVRAYPGWHETGEHFDRIGSNAELGGLEVLSKVGSDHPRIRAVVNER
jgi:hypothetical protein